MDSIDSIKQRILSLTAEPVRLIAVTKKRTIPEIEEVIKAGIAEIGENRVQEAEEKMQSLPPSVVKHLIGHLQTNKVAKAMRLFDMIQSVNSLKVAQKISEECEKINKTMPILIQVNTSGEPQKSGVMPDQAIALIQKIAELPHLKIEGLMTIAEHSEDPEKVRACFRKLRELFEAIKKNPPPNVTMLWLSMGMSEDYKIALQEGSNMLRLGRAIFDQTLSS